MKKTCPFYRKRKKDGDNMDSKLLKWYVKLYEKRSLRQAAADLYISPQGLSHGLQSLENELDVILFERTAQGLTPTEAGSYFYSVCKGKPGELSADGSKPSRIGRADEGGFLRMQLWSDECPAL